jgi:amino acid transporter
MSLLLFWLLTWVHCFGLRFSNWISIGSAVFGTLVPMVMIIGLAVFWVFSGKTMATPLGDWHAWIPTVHDFNNIGFFANVLFSLLGLEVVAVYAGSVANPDHTYPKALIIAASVILLTLIGSSLALCVIVPADKIAIITGLVDVMQRFFSAFHLENMTYFIGLCMVIGGLGIASSWMLGLAKSIHIALSSSSVTIGSVKKLNKYQVPIGVLWFQAAVYTAIMLIFLCFPNLNRSYWILSATTAQFALLYYIIVFCAAMKLLRMKTKTMLNIIFPIMAMFLCTSGLLAGFIPPMLH